MQIYYSDFNTFGGYKHTRAGQWPIGRFSLSVITDTVYRPWRVGHTGCGNCSRLFVNRALCHTRNSARCIASITAWVITSYGFPVMNPYRHQKTGLEGYVS